MELKYKIICIIAIIIAIIICFYIYKLNKKEVKVIEQKGSKLVPIPKYDFKMDKTKIDPYFDIFIGDKYAGKIIFELIDDIAPKTAMNFRYLCSKNFIESALPAYQNKYIDKIIKDKCIIGGSGINYSIFGSYFEDETHELKFNQPGLLMMYNDEKNKNTSQFMITLNKIPEFDDRFVVFGIIKGGFEVIEKINSIECRENIPNVKCKIVKCGLTE